MSYQVLARKWRPQRFSELVGQEHVVQALVNGLTSGRLHHAFLFTGTRGVGKTTIARILAKSLNCEQGVSAEPCGECSACVDITAGRYPDLMEIDAASRTGVDDTRDLLDKVIYAPSRGRCKVYLIDEVHMLSLSSFNALLKTLEEPPEHVRFLLATTDPQKVPVTVLSRCLQFNLRRLTRAEIGGQLAHILGAEKIEFDAEAIDEIARSADGSLRDGLSLLDQALAYGAGAVRSAEVQRMLGAVGREVLVELYDALAAGDRERVASALATLEARSPSYARVTQDLIEITHDVAVRQLLGKEVDSALVDDAHLQRWAQALSPEVVQLHYQLLLRAVAELQQAPDGRVAFAMTILRLLAFEPMAGGGGATPAAGGRPRSASYAAADQGGGSLRAATAVAEAQPPSTRSGGEPAGSPAARWAELVENQNLRGPIRELALRLEPREFSQGSWRLALSDGYEYLLTEFALAELGRAVEKFSGGAKLVVGEGGAAEATLAAAQEKAQQAQAEASEAALQSDPVAQALVREFGAQRVNELH
ncbi:MAG: DNA polymerase III subunit gamma/tau [Xanthomonadales bacterium]|nr:DNA polymerase III subunit gamma/tau [Xanthomonadales bacterium]